MNEEQERMLTAWNDPPSSQAEEIAEARLWAAEQKHTPGPWSVYDQRHLFTNHEGSARLIAGDIWIACVHGSHVGPQSKEEADANISLIAAAPELLEALECITAVIGLTPIDRGNLEALEEAYEQARAAIAKAKGEQL